MKKILIYGNSGVGKTTFAKKKAEQFGLPYLDLDTVAWREAGVREELSKSQEKIWQFTNENEQWVIEGCYGQLIESLTTLCTELHFLNPGIAASIENNANRGWEPHKYESLEAQNKQFEMLQNWVKEYETRRDEFSYHFHKAIFDGFDGDKYEYTSVDQYNA